MRVTQDACFSLMAHTKQILLVTVCDATAGIGAACRTDARQTDGGWTDGGRTDRRGSRNSYLDLHSTAHPSPLITMVPMMSERKGSIKFRH